MNRWLAPLLALALAACTYRTPTTEWTLAEGDVVTTSFTIAISRDDEGAEDSTLYNATIDACTVTVDQPDVLRFERIAPAREHDIARWIVWAKKPGKATLTLQGCDANATGWSDPQVTIDVTVTAR